MIHKLNKTRNNSRNMKCEERMKPMRKEPLFLLEREDIIRDKDGNNIQ